MENADCLKGAQTANDCHISHFHEMKSLCGKSWGKSFILYTGGQIPCTL